MWIGHLDADCFYASAERVRRPELAEEPVGVVGNQGACVIARCYLMRKFGVKTGEPIWTARKKCPHGHFLTRDFRWYEMLSRQMLGLMQQVSPEVEYYSVDEFFFSGDQLARHYNQPLEQAVRSLQQEVLRKVGVPVSIGLATSRTLAKLCSDISKPFGIRILPEEEREAFLREVPLAEVSGMGRRRTARMTEYGLQTCLQFIQTPRRWVRQHLTVVGERLWHELRGEAVIPIQPQRPQHKLVSRGGSVGKGGMNELNRLTGWVVRTLERLIEALMNHDYVCTRLTMQVIYKDRGPCWGRLRLLEDSATMEQLQPVALALLDHLYERGRTVSHLHLIASGISPATQRQLSLFSRTQPTIDELKRQINSQLGRFKIRSGATLFLPELYEDEAHYYDICDIQGKTCF